MGLRAAKGNAHIFYGVWRERNGWTYKVEDRMNWAQWGASGFETRDAAVESMKEVLKSMKVEL